MHALHIIRLTPRSILLYAQAKQQLAELKRRKEAQRVGEREALDTQMQAHLTSLRVDSAAKDEASRRKAVEETERKYIQVRADVWMCFFSDQLSVSSSRASQCTQHIPHLVQAEEAKKAKLIKETRETVAVNDEQLKQHMRERDAERTKALAVCCARFMSMCCMMLW